MDLEVVWFRWVSELLRKAAVVESLNRIIDSSVSKYVKMSWGFKIGKLFRYWPAYRHVPINRVIYTNFAE